MGDPDSLLRLRDGFRNGIRPQRSLACIIWKKNVTTGIRSGFFYDRYCCG
jgi:hypothetical protein